MPFIQEILKYGSLSVVGLEKNCGKTECLNYILNRLPREGRKVCVTSIGIDGERIDQVTSTSKPEITLSEGLLFSTSEKHYRMRNLLSEVVGISEETTSLGRVITSRVIREGKVILSGPSSSASLIRWMKEVKALGSDLVIVDGALSRLSSASPAVTESMILATGAALSSNIPTLVAKTAFVVQMIGLDLMDPTISRHETVTISSMAAEFEPTPECRRVMISGALTDRMLNRIAQEKNLGTFEVVVRDFTKLFITPRTYGAFVKLGGRLRVESRSKLVAVCVNPLSPSGFRLDSDTLCRELSTKISLPVYDIVKNRYITN